MKPINWRFVLYQVAFASAIYLIGSTIWLYVFILSGNSVSEALSRLAGLSIGSLIASAIYVLRVHL